MRTLCFPFLLPLALAGACTDAADLELGSSSQAIIKGDVVDPEQSGHVAVRIDDTRDCSGTLLRNDWLITATHCIQPAMRTNPGAFRVKMGRQSVPIAQIIEHPSATLDVTLLRLAQPMKMKGVNWGHEQPLYTGAATDLIGHTVDCYGYGAFTATPDHAGADFGELHKANLFVYTAFTSIFSIQMNELGQIVGHGDSGGGCFYQGQLAGVTSRGDSPDIDGAIEIAIPHVRSWIDQHVPAMTAPPAPALDYSSYEEGIQLKWKPTPRALRYVLRLPGNLTENLVGDSTSYYVDGLSQNSVYTFELCAVNSRGSTCTSVQAGTARRLPVPAPAGAAPTHLEVKMLPVENTVIWPFRVEWKGDSIAWGYEVERRMYYPVASGAWTTVAQVPAGTLAAVVKSVMPEMYHYRVCAFSWVNRICSAPATLLGAAGGANVLADPGFDAQLLAFEPAPGLSLPWRVEGPGIHIDGEDPRGPRLVLDASDKARWRAVTQDVDVVPHHTYALTAIVQGDGRNFPGEMGARALVGDKLVQTSHFGSDEGLVKLVFDSGNATKVRIYLGFESLEGGERMVVDDLVLEQH